MGEPDFVQGQSLRAHLSRRRVTETEILSLLVELLRVVASLHALRPPAIYRGLCLENILIQNSRGELTLVGFEAVREAGVDLKPEARAVSGVLGYMPPEQLAGQAVPASDLYAVGATAVAMLTGRDPQTLVGDDQRLEWESAVYASDGLKSVLSDLLERDVNRRASDALDVIARLEEVGRSGVDPQARQSSSVVSASQMGQHKTTLWVEPPPTPRVPPSLMMGTQAPGASFGLLFGSLFGGIGGAIGLGLILAAFSTGEQMFWAIGPLFVLIFGGLGSFFFVSGYKKILLLREIWRHGEVVQGRLLDATRDRSIRVNGRSPVLLTYTYTAHGELQHGSGHSWDQTLRKVPEGSILAVLVHPSHPNQSLPFL